MKIDRKNSSFPLVYDSLRVGQVYGRSDGKTVLKTVAGYVILESGEDYKGSPTGLTYVLLDATLVIND